jgi:hypothetical protein
MMPQLCFNMGVIIKKRYFQMLWTIKTGCKKITWLICLLRIRQGPGRLFLLLLIAAQE